MTKNKEALSQMWLTTKQVATRFGVSARTISRWVSTGAFPKPIAITPRAFRWPESALVEFEMDAMNRNSHAKKNNDN